MKEINHYFEGYDFEQMETSDEAFRRVLELQRDMEQVYRNPAKYPPNMLADMHGLWHRLDARYKKIKELPKT